MKVLSVRTLILGEPKKINDSSEISHVYSVWKKLMKKHKQEGTEFDAFYAGYILANPIVRDELKEVEEKQPKRNNNVSNILWKR